MSFEIKLKMGFFKTRRYCLTVGHKQIILTPHDADHEKYIIDDKELISICIFKKSRQLVELEIVTSEKVYIGSFAVRNNSEEVCRFLIKEFGNRFIYN